MRDVNWETIACIAAITIAAIVLIALFFIHLDDRNDQRLVQQYNRLCELNPNMCVMH